MITRRKVNLNSFISMYLIWPSRRRKLFFSI